MTPSIRHALTHPRPNHPAASPARRSARATLAAVAALGVVAFNAPCGHAAAGPEEVTASASVTLSPGANIQGALDAAAPGATINLRSGTYRGPVVIKKAGVVLQSAPGGRATVTASLPGQPCNASSPARQRTIEVEPGADNVQVRNLDIVGGVYVNGKGTNEIIRWLTQTYNTNDVSGRRSAPGLGKRDPSAAQTIVQWYAKKLQANLDPIDNLTITGNTMTRRGIFAGLVRNANISNNTIAHQDCGIGSAIWLNASYFGQVTGNTITDLAVSTWKHYMQEGIRMGGSSAYNMVSGNNVHDIAGEARGISTDYAASFNTVTHNTVSNVYNGLDDEQDGWGNAWTSNKVSGTRNKGIVFGGLGAALFSKVNLNYATVGAVIADNVVTATPGIYIGSVRNCTFRNNTGSLTVDKATRTRFGVGNRSVPVDHGATVVSTRV